MRIGGELELDLAGLGPSRAPALEEWRARLSGSTILASTGRAALALILDAVRRADRKARVFLLPSYLCGSILPPFAEAGFEVRFIPMGGDLRLPADELSSLARREGAAGILFIDYFGSPVSEVERQALCDLKKSLWVIEDCVPGGLVEGGGRGVGAVGHFAFTSFRKYTPLPDGALIWNRSELTIEAPGHAESSEWIRLRLLGKLLRGEVLRGGNRSGAWTEAGERAFLELFAASEQLLDAGSTERGPSRLSAGLGGFDLIAAAARKRENSRRLRGRFHEDCPGWAALLGAPGENASPSFLPLVCRDRPLRDGLRSHLARAGIFCAVHWDLPAGLPENPYQASHDLSARILCLPLDHRCGPGEMDAMHAEVLAFRPC